MSRVVAEASRHYRAGSGLEVTPTKQVELPSDDTRHVYGLGSRDVVEAARMDI
jgi:hypothetical protein